MRICIIWSTFIKSNSDTPVPSWGQMDNSVQHIIKIKIFLDAMYEAFFDILPNQI